MSTIAKADVTCMCCLETIAKGHEMKWAAGGWHHPWCPSSGTYLADIEDSEGHPLALRMPVGTRPRITPKCQHRHSRLCRHEDNPEIPEITEGYLSDIPANNPPLSEPLTVSEANGSS